MVNVPSGTLIAFADADHFNRLSEVTSGTSPTDFRWVMIGVPTIATGGLVDSSGLTIDMSNPAIQFTFAQVYAGTCNPANGDFSTCLLLESYTAGDPGLVGSMFVHVIGSEATGSVDITWQGITDRFGPPPQWHQHQNIADFDVAVVVPVQP
jgi:hypothetical protein